MKKILSLFLVLALLVSTLCLIACDKKAEGDDDNKKDTTTQPTDTSTADDDASSTPDTDTSAIPSDTGNTPDDDTSASDAEPDEEPDMTPGSADNPVFLGEDPYTVTLEAGKSFHVAVKNPGNQRIVIADANAKVIYSGNEYEADDTGIVLPLVTESGDGRKSAVLEITSKDGSAASFTVLVEAMPGTMGNPLPLTDLSDLNAVPAKDQTLYYSWTATANGNFSVQAKTAVSNFVMMVDNRTTGENKGATSATLGVLAGETVLIAVGTVSGNPVDGGLDYAFTMVEADPTADFNFTVAVSSLSDGAVAGVTVEFYNRADDTLVTTLATDVDGKATYTGIWRDLYAKITVPDGYELLSDNDDTTDDLLGEFHLTSGLFGNATAVFTLITAE
ncbi:MAG: hypothetical protein IJW49_00310 [Clostridia bacterium]|nr:hypothetical protein [Clostridia bacterium]